MAGYVDGSMRAFLDKLATASPEPGGGSVAAMTGALGAGLVSMVCSLTVGKEKYADVQGDITSLLEKAEACRERLQSLIQEDTEAYGGLLGRHEASQGHRRAESGTRPADAGDAS